MSIKLALTNVFCLCALALYSTISPFLQIGSGHFSGEMACYSSGNQLAVVYNDNQSGVSSFISSVIYKYSNDGGLHWQSSVVETTQGGFSQPTLSRNGNEIIVSYMKNGERKMAISTNNGIFWTPMTMGKSFEKGTLIEHIGDQYRSFELDLPYPEDRQSEFCSVLNPEDMVSPQFVTDNELSWNQTPVYFHGGDIIYGAIRSNSDIWIKRTPGVGTNNGWPIFYGTIITSGNILSSETYPASQIFRGELITGAPPIEMPSLHPDLGEGALIGPANYDPQRITLVTVNNRNYEVWVGQLSAPRTETMPVYSQYPAGGTYLGTNSYTVRDTTWTLHSTGTISTTKMRVNSKLWIRGNFGGDQTWICPDTISIVGDILLQGTSPGLPPDLSPNSNTTDFVTLVSGQKILLKYGFRDPQTQARVHPLCRADSNPVRIYASLIALNSDPQNPRSDGCFSFEYQHPHSAVPSYNYQGTIYNDIDLHRYIFPQTPGNPWPSNIDMPRYNPLWPEASPYLERGVFQLWGSLLQRRRGYVHRSYFDIDYNLGNLWDIAQDYCGGPSFDPNNIYSDPVFGITLSPANFPGATGSGIGYKKDYRGDKRRGINADLFSFGIKLGERGLSAGSFTSRYVHRYSQRIREKSFARRGDTALYSVNDQLICELNGQFYDLSPITQNLGDIIALAVTNDNNALVMQIAPFGNQYRLQIQEINPITNELVFQSTDYVMTMLNTLAVSPEGAKVIVKLVYDNEVYDDGYLLQVSRMYGQLNEQVIVPLIHYPQSWLSPSPQVNSSRLYLRSLANNILDFWIAKPLSGGNANNPHSALYHARATVAGLPTEDEHVPEPTPVLSAYPNPMQNLLKISISAPSRRTIEIYNLRGQKVRQLLSTGEAVTAEEIIWDGLNEQGLPCGRGLYLIRMETEQGQVLKRMIVKI